MRKFGYRLRNPVKRGLASSLREWAWSSYSFYEGSDDGLVRIDTV
ncbi:MAG: hypothetical protein WCB14_12335 [Candidatus Acidiferrales bacterium]